MDTNGSRAHVNQPGGPVFFLAGLSQISSVVSRAFEVPEGKYLFVPLVTLENDNVDVDPPLSGEALRDLTKAGIDLVTDLHASVDAVPVTNLFARRAASPVFNFFAASDDNLLSFFLGRPFTGLDDPIVADGYYLMIEPLPPGTHVINFGATVGPPVNFSKDITDTITVVRVPLAERVHDLISSVQASGLSQENQRRLLPSLQRAEQRFGHEKPRSSIVQLRAFQNKLRRILRHDPALRDQLSRASQSIIERVVAIPASVLPAGFTLFGRTGGEYLAEYMQHVLPLATNGDFALPHAVSLENDPVYFLQRPLFTLPVPVLQNYFVPDDGYVCFPIVFFWGDNVDTSPPFTADELRNGINSIVDTITGVHVTIDGVLYTNLQAYRTESPAFSMYFPSSNNFYSVLLKHPLEGIVDPVVAAGYVFMLKPLSAGLHDVRLGATVGGPNNFSFARHFQINSIPLGQELARQTAQLGASVTTSPLPPDRQIPLLRDLQHAGNWFERDHLRTGIGRLRAFQGKIRLTLQADPALRDQWIQSAQSIINRARERTNG